MTAVYGGKVGNMRQLKPKKKGPTKAKEHTYKLHGGPWDGHKVALAEPSTVLINVAGWFGRYTCDGKGGLRWVFLQKSA